MQANLPLKEMTCAEKLETINRIWDDLVKKPDEIPSPDWHKDVLSARVERVKSGEAVFQDLEDSKMFLRQKLNED